MTTLIRGTKYGLVGRNGTGKSTLLHAIAERTIPMPPHIHIIHVEQEASPSDRSAVQTVLETDEERTYLLKVEKILLDENKDVHEGIDLNEVYERLDEIGSDEAIARAGGILGRGLIYSHHHHSYARFDSSVFKPFNGQ